MQDVCVTSVVFSGAKYVQSVLGGYRNYVKGTKFMTLAATASMLACIVLTIVALIKNVAKVPNEKLPLIEQ